MSRLKVFGHRRGKRLASPSAHRTDGPPSSVRSPSGGGGGQVRTREVLAGCDVRLWDYLIEILNFGPRGWFLVTDDPAPAQPAAFHELPDYFSELGQDGWELVSMTAISSTDRVVVVFKRPSS